MKIINKTGGKIIAETIIVPASLLDQSLGLLKYKTPVAMLLKTRFGIHTLGMRYPIDVLVLDKLNRVVAIKENLKPNRIFVWNIKFDTVIELPEGKIAKTNTKLKDKILFSEREN